MSQAADVDNGGRSRDASPYQLLLFDVDDTLLDSTWFELGMLQTLGAHPLTAGLDARQFLGHLLQVPKVLTDKLRTGELSTKAFTRARWKAAFSMFDVTPDADSVDELDSLFLQAGMSFITADAQLVRLFQELAEHYQLGIVTNGIYDPYAKIKRLGLSGVFPEHAIFHSEQHGLRKPDPRLYAIAIERFRQRPAETLFIGDSWMQDVVAPMELGMGAIWVNGKNEKPSTAHVPLAVVTEIMEIRGVLLSKER